MVTADDAPCVPQHITQMGLLAMARKELVDFSPFKLPLLLDLSE